MWQQKTLSVSYLNPALVSHWWLSCKSASVFWHWSGYLLCNAFAFQVVLLAFFSFSVAVFFNFWAFSCFSSPPFNSVSRYKSIFGANFLAFLQQSVNLFLFHVLKLVLASDHPINSSIKYQVRPIVSVLWDISSWVKSHPRLLLGR